MSTYFDLQRAGLLWLILSHCWVSVTMDLSSCFLNTLYVCVCAYYAHTHVVHVCRSGCSCVCLSARSFWLCCFEVLLLLSDKQRGTGVRAGWLIPPSMCSFPFITVLRDQHFKIFSFFYLIKWKWKEMCLCVPLDFSNQLSCVLFTIFFFFALVCCLVAKWRNSPNFAAMKKKTQLQTSKWMSDLWPH